VTVRPGAATRTAICSLSRGGGVLDAKGRFRAGRGEAIRRARSARRFRPAVREEEGLVRMRDAQTYEDTPQGDDPGCLARFF